MTTAERRKVHEALEALGFDRTFYGDDEAGDGVYQEIWQPKGQEKGDQILITWGPKTSSSAEQCGATRNMSPGVRGILVCTLPKGHDGEHGSLGRMWSEVYQLRCEKCRPVPLGQEFSVLDTCVRLEGHELPHWGSDGKGWDQDTPRAETLIRAIERYALANADRLCGAHDPSYGSASKHVTCDLPRGHSGDHQDQRVDRTAWPQVEGEGRVLCGAIAQHIPQTSCELARGHEGPHVDTRANPQRSIVWRDPPYKSPWDTGLKPADETATGR